MNIKLLLLSALIALPFCASAQQKPRSPAEYALSAAGTIEIGPDGHVRDYKLDSKLDPKIAEMVDRNVRQWTFEPILVDDRPVTAKTRLRLQLTAVPVEQGYAVKVANVWFGEPEQAHKMRPPRYPMTAQMANLGAKVILLLKLDDKGNVQEVHPYQISLGARARSETIAAQWRKEFQNSAVAAAKRWKFDLSEEVNGKPVEAIISVPVEYMMGPPSDNVGWKAYVPGPVNPYPPSWANDGDEAVSASLAAMKDGDMLSMKSRFRLKDKVIGEML